MVFGVGVRKSSQGLEGLTAGVPRYSPPPQGTKDTLVIFSPLSPHSQADGGVPAHQSAFQGEAAVTI